MDVAHLKLHCPDCNEPLTFTIAVHTSAPVTFESRPDGVPKALANVAIAPVVHYCESQTPSREAPGAQRPRENTSGEAS